jgi:modulator of FtsH protease HflC
MNGNVLRTGLVVLGVLVLVLIYASAFTVSQTQQALVLQFGRVRTVLNQAGTDKPGLYFKLPFFESITLFEKRLLDLDLPVQTVLSADRQNLEVDAFARYKISDPLRFYQAVNNVQVANQRLSSFTNAAMRNVLASASRDAIVRTQREGLMNRIQEDVNRQAKNLGIEIIDLRLTRVDLPAANSQAVYGRMQTERQREAADLRANGERDAATIKARADRDVTVLVAEANQKADQLRGQGDADRNRILAQAFGQDPDFFAFYRSMQAYEKGLTGTETRLVIGPGSDFFRYFNDPQGRPRPAAAAPGAPASGQPAPATGQ